MNNDDWKLELCLVVNIVGVAFEFYGSDLKWKQFEFWNEVIERIKYIVTSGISDAYQFFWKLLFSVFFTFGCFFLEGMSIKIPKFDRYDMFPVTSYKNW